MCKVGRIGRHPFHHGLCRFLNLNLCFSLLLLAVVPQDAFLLDMRYVSLFFHFFDNAIDFALLISKSVALLDDRIEPLSSVISIQSGTGSIYTPFLVILKSILPEADIPSLFLMISGIVTIPLDDIFTIIIIIFIFYTCIC